MPGSTTGRRRLERPSLASRLLRRPLTRRARWMMGGGGTLVLLGLAVPTALIPGQAQAAKTDLDAAVASLRAGDIASAEASIASARGHVDSARSASLGPGAFVLRGLPVVGSAMADVRHLVSVLDKATAAAEIGVEIYPSVVGPDATFFQGDKIDRESFEQALDGAMEVGDLLESAHDDLEQIEGTAPVIGENIRQRRDEALSYVEPLAQTFDDIQPGLKALPAVLGFDGPKTYLITILNPAELRFSGGATLAFAPMTWDEGALEIGDSIDLTSDYELYEPISWQHVAGDSLLRSPAVRMRNATFAPSWSVAGEELLRAWESATQVFYDGVIALDVVTLARLVGVTGGIKAPGYGTVTQDNLVQTLVGSYDDYYPNPSAQDSASTALIPAFKRQVLSGGDYPAKLRVLADAARGRHLAVYIRNLDALEALDSLGLDGNLTRPERDYVGVFTQNTNGSKVDIYQRRTVQDDIRLTDGGAAHHRLDVQIANDTPPFGVPGVDQRSGYFTRWAGMVLSVFMPKGAEVEEASIAGRQWTGRVRHFFDHDYLTIDHTMPPGSATEATASWSVPDAVTVDPDSGTLTYDLAADPQGMASPQQLFGLKVRLPRGYVATSVPEGWTVDGRTLQLAPVEFTGSDSWTISAQPQS